jgi:hypothetical protein
LNKLSTQGLLSIIISVFIIYFIVSKYKEEHTLLQNSAEKAENKLKNEVSDTKSMHTDVFYVKETSQKLKFLMKDQEMIDILNNVRFIKKFDKSRYRNIIIYIDKLMKIYIYILSDRYDVNTHIPIFTDIKTRIMEIFYSLIFVVPEQFKHIYGFDPYVEIEKSKIAFMTKTRKMQNILQNYNHIAKENVYFNHNKHAPYERNKEHVLP